ncbi:hypothetical protein [Paracoccus sp. (in: a-proteobacteria)]|uniref:hypothetical protein n=1 Tax=Paracoccus sp. TaxID=267 RepID=UPI0026DEE291|nr:hypothetical protein [Paracoccus sp. (in: a-proteobacteria)]MDO5648727.1 hypothetical protein [Paracoccus sp. (in: a-proteobacteria)]
MIPRITTHSRPDGGVEVRQITETVIATFTDPAHAALFCAALTADYQPDARFFDHAGGRPDTAHAPIPAPAPDAAQNKPDTPPNRQARRDEMEDDRPRQPPETTVQASDDELQWAFARIESGDKIQDIAAEKGWNWRSLRASWSRECQRRQKDVAASGTVNCTLCDREFTPSLSNPDTCARCAKG